MVDYFLKTIFHDWIEYGEILKRYSCSLHQDYYEPFWLFADIKSEGFQEIWIEGY
jgi:hypothetical protein